MSPKQRLHLLMEDGNQDDETNNSLMGKGWKEQPKGKGKSKRAAVMIPKELQGRDNVSIEPHGGDCA